MEGKRKNKNLNFIIKLETQKADKTSNTEESKYG